MNKDTEKTAKKVFRPAEIQLIKYNIEDMISVSSGYDPFLGEEDPLTPREPDMVITTWNPKK